jgi:mono/diheme cytochrome c family protein
MRTIPRLGLVAALVAAVGPLQAAAITGAVDYGRDIRPILSENCFYCHGQDASHRKGKLRLDTLDGQRDRNAVVPGKPNDSEIIKRILTKDPDDQMPPPDSNRHLTDQQKDLLRRWITEGAPFDGHWAFTAPVRPEEPKNRNAVWARNPIDRFVAAKLDSYGLFPSPEASKETLIRRLTLDLTGLPPEPSEIDAFLADWSPEAYEKVVDRLLASPHYGERMALPWLDAARYADSNGFQQDGDTYQWVWRDWVVQVMNDNMPFDQFTIEQLAGDLLPGATREQKLATAFNRNGLLNGEGGNIAEEQRHVLLFDRVDTTSTNWLGLTVACAQCHDHKYDPITQKDYYALMAAFNNVPESGTAGRITQKIRSADPLLDLATPEQKARKGELEKALNQVRDALKKEQVAWQERVLTGEDHVEDEGILALLRRCPTPELTKDESEKIRKHFDEKVAGALDGRPKQRVQEAENRLNELKDDYPMVMVMSDAKPRDTHILDRGNYESPKEKVGVDVPAFLPPLPPDAPRNRLGIARWLVAKEQPLTARVIANRAWQTFFGIGIIKTSEDFGVQSEAPLHRELLDWLAVELRDSGWDVKKLHRLIVTSATYRQTSHVTPSLLEHDPENRLFARAPRFRLPAMLIRDQALAASGLLVRTIGGRPVYPYQPKDIWDSLQITKERDFSYPQSSGDDLYRRSLYTFWRRTVAPANMFDASQRQTCSVRTTSTSTPLHALTTLNDPTFVEAARALASKVMTEPAEQRLAVAFRRVLSRWPDDTERALLAKSLDKQRARFTDAKAAEAFLAVGASKRDPAQDPVQLAAYAAVCLGILNLDEAVSRQ